MTTDQIMLFGILVVLFGLLVWGRFRYDLVAFVALLVTVMAGLIAPEDAFHGFGHPAVVIIALVLIVSRGLMNSGAVEMIARYVVTARPGSFRSISASWQWWVRRCRRHQQCRGAGAADVARHGCRAQGQAGGVADADAAVLRHHPGRHDHPDRHAAQHRHCPVPPGCAGRALSMFDFAPVGLAVATAGIAYVAFIGWRLIPERADTISLEGDAGLYVAEARVKEGSKSIGLSVGELYPARRRQ
jgi:hypothetical protein